MNKRHDVASHGTPMNLPSAGRRLLIALGASVSAALAPAEVVAAPYVAFPSQDSLREVQLAALACARENTAAECQRAQQLGDPLLDHPRLPANCKDLIWLMLQKARPASSNSYGRRAAIEDPAERLLLVCRSAEKPEPAPNSGGPGTSPSGGAGIKFGGS